MVRGAHGVCAEIADEREIVRHRREGQRAAVVRVVLVTAHAPDAQRRAVEQNALALDAHLAESEAVDKIVNGRSVPEQPHRDRVQRGRRGRPCTDVRGQERAFQNALALGHGARPEREFLPRRPDLHGHGRAFFEIDDADADMGAPFSADVLGRDVDGAHIRAPDPLDGDGARDPAVGHIVVGNVQGALLGKAVVRDDFERVLPLRRAAHDGFKGRVGVVVPRDPDPVEENARRMADAAKDETEISAAREPRRIPPLAAVIAECGIALPAARNGDRKRLARAVARKRRERPEFAREFLLAADSVERIAARCGYNNTEHFIRQFRARTGTTPTGYRKNR